jgi:hypothetical protein
MIISELICLFLISFINYLYFIFYNHKEPVYKTIIDIVLLESLLFFNINSILDSDYETIRIIIITFSIFIGLCIFLLTKLSFIISLFIGFLILIILLLNCNPYKSLNTNKFTKLNYLPKEYVPSQQQLLKNTNINEILFPVVIKPINCTGNAKNLKIVYSKEEAIKIIKNINIDEYMIQTYLSNYPIEVGILYEKFPWDKNGNISVIIKDSKNKIKTCNNGDKCYKDVNLNTPELLKTINDISSKIPNMFCCRYDILTKNLDELKMGKNFKVLEINGVMGFDLDRSTYFFTEVSLYSFMSCIKWLFTRMFIGLYNIISLNGYSPINMLKLLIQSTKYTFKCENWEHQYSVDD